MNQAKQLMSCRRSQNYVADDGEELTVNERKDLEHPFMDFLNNSTKIRLQQLGALLIKRLYISKRGSMAMFFEVSSNIYIEPVNSSSCNSHCLVTVAHFTHVCFRIVCQIPSTFSIRPSHERSSFYALGRVLVQGRYLQLHYCRQFKSHGQEDHRWTVE